MIRALLILLALAGAVAQTGCMVTDCLARGTNACGLD